MTQVTIPQGSSSVNFYYKDSTAGIYTLSVAETPSQGWTDDSQTITNLTYSGQTQEEDMALWTHSATLEINNSACGTALTDYQIAFTINTEALVSLGYMAGDGKDIRFIDSDGTTQLPYWIESGMNTTNTRIWIKIPSVPAATTKNISLYYGNPAAVAISNADYVFGFFDDFDTYDDTVWEKTHSSATVSNSKLQITYGAVYTEAPVLSSTHDNLVEAKMTWLDSTGSYSGLMIGNDHAHPGQQWRGGCLDLLYDPVVQREHVCLLLGRGRKHDRV